MTDFVSISSQTEVCTLLDGKSRVFIVHTADVQYDCTHTFTFVLTHKFIDLDTRKDSSIRINLIKATDCNTWYMFTSNQTIRDTALSKTDVFVSGPGVDYFKQAQNPQNLSITLSICHQIKIMSSGLEVLRWTSIPRATNRKFRVLIENSRGFGRFGSIRA